MSRAKKWNKGLSKRGYKSGKGGCMEGLQDEVCFGEENVNGVDVEDETDDTCEFHREPIASKIYMWEFGQNDPKRDSGNVITHPIPLSLMLKFHYR